MLLFMVTQSKPTSSRIDQQALERYIIAMGLGDHDAFADLYRATDRAVYVFSLSIVGNAHDAEDVMHDTFVKVLENAARYQAQGKPLAWVFTIARRLCLMRLRKQRTLPLDALGEPPSEAYRPEAALDRIVLNAALTHLPDQERQIVLLHAAAGLKHREIAKLLELPLSSVLSKYARSLAKLERILEGTA